MHNFYRNFSFENNLLSYIYTTVLPEAIYAHLLGLCLEPGLVHHHSLHNLSVEEPVEGQRDQEVEDKGKPHVGLLIPFLMINTYLLNFKIVKK